MIWIICMVLLVLNQLKSKKVGFVYLVEQESQSNILFKLIMHGMFYVGIFGAWVSRKNRYPLIGLSFDIAIKGQFKSPN